MRRPWPCGSGCAVSVEPVKADACDARITGQHDRADQCAPSPGRTARTSLAARPALCSKSKQHGRSAASVRRVWPCTPLPVSKAAAIWPVKIASGKFHGRDAGEDAVRGSRCARRWQVLAGKLCPAAAHNSAGSPPLRAVPTPRRQESCPPLAPEGRRSGRSFPHKDRRRGSRGPRVRSATRGRGPGLGEAASAVSTSSRCSGGQDMAQLGAPVARVVQRQGADFRPATRPAKTGSAASNNVGGMWRARRFRSAVRSVPASVRSQPLELVRSARRKVAGPVRQHRAWRRG